MKAIKIIINEKELILPQENAGMLTYRGLTYEEIEVDIIPNIMEDLIEELKKTTTF
jgi:hypothetical protein